MTIDPDELARCVDAGVALVRTWPKLKRLALVYFLRRLASRIEEL